MESVLNIEPKKSVSYPVYIQKDLKYWEEGLLPEATKNSRYFLVTDKSLPTSLLKTFLSPLSRYFPGGLHDKNILWLKGGERNKAFSNLELFYNQLVYLGADRQSCLLALGGGVVGDFCGFMASSFLRGIDFIQVPTSLLAIVDSSIGGKVGVNIKKGKNLVGAFHHPRLVYVNIDFLYTLPKKEWHCGLAEMLKHALIAKNDRVLQDFFDFFMKKKNIASAEFLAVLLDSLQIKARVVWEDEKEQGCRASLNLGHTIAHALESVSHYRRFSHGEAVSRGIVTALLLSRNLLGLDASWIKEFLHSMKLLGLPQDTSGYKAKKLYAHMSYDKKAFQGEPRFVLMKERGKILWDQKVSFHEFEKAWKEQKHSFG